MHSMYVFYSYMCTHICRHIYIYTHTHTYLYKNCGKCLLTINSALSQFPSLHFTHVPKSFFPPHKVYIVFVIRKRKNNKIEVSSDPIIAYLGLFFSELSSWMCPKISKQIYSSPWQLQ